MKGRVSEISF